MFQSSGLQPLLKEGSRHYAGLEEAILRNIEACKQISKITRTSLGPHGMNKMIVNQLDKLFITSDAATIVREVDVHHPAAKMIALASKMQDNEVGDGTNLVIVMAGELMNQAEQLIRMGLHPSEILIGFEKGGKKCLELLEGLVAYTIENVRDKAELTKVLKSVVGSKHYGNEDILGPLIAQAALISMPRSSKDFNIDNVRVQKVLGASLLDSSVIHGMVVMRGSENTVTRVEKAKIAIFSTGIETETGDTKGTVLITNAEDLQNYTKGEEQTMEAWIKALAEAGVNVAIASSSISEIGLHFLTKYKIMTLKIMSKFEIRRIAKTLGATMIGRQGAPTPDEMGYADEVAVTEIGSTRVTIFKNDEDSNKISTIVLRGSTNSMLDDSERAIDDGVNTIKSIVRDQRFCAGAGATEIHIASQIQTFAKTQPGLDQYAVEKFGQALEVVPRVLTENSGHNAEEMIAKLYSETAKSPFMGVDVEDGKVKDMKELEIYDSIETKSWALKLAIDAVLTILRVDQIIMSKPAGGPKPRGPQAPDLD